MQVTSIRNKFMRSFLFPCSQRSSLKNRFCEYTLMIQLHHDMGLSKRMSVGCSNHSAILKPFWSFTGSDFNRVQLVANMTRLYIEKIRTFRKVSEMNEKKV